MADDRQSTEGRQPVRAGQLRVGCSQVGLQPARYFRRFSALEVQQTFFNPPRRAVLERQRALAPPGFSFVVKAWQLITHEPTSPGYRRLGTRRLPAPPEEYGGLRLTRAVEEALRVTQEAADALAADALLFETPHSFTPGAASRSRLAAFFERLDRRGRLVIWDPRGLWQRHEAERLCADLGLVLCTDPLQEAPSPGAGPVYFRVSGLGRRSLPEQDLLTLEERVRGVSGHCIFDTLEMHRDAARLLTLLPIRSP